MSEPNLGDLLSGEGISSLLKNPEVIAKLPKIMEALGPMLAQMQKPTSAPAADEGDAPEALSAAAEAGAGLGREKKGSSPKIGSRHTALLHALEPYLSDERRTALSYILKVATLIDVVGEVL